MRYSHCVALILRNKTVVGKYGLHPDLESLSTKFRFVCSSLEPKLRVYTRHTPVSYTHLDVYKRQRLFIIKLHVLYCMHLC